MLVSDSVLVQPRWLFDYGKLMLVECLMSQEATFSTRWCLMRAASEANMAAVISKVAFGQRAASS